AGKVKTVQGSELTVTTSGGVAVDGAKVSAADIVASNGVIHVIDSVVLPK
ncbi:MAG TPA: fasciclin domain-containing protein, partial [Burkholderiaceae bacterium]